MWFQVGQSQLRFRCFFRGGLLAHAPSAKTARRSTTAGAIRPVGREIEYEKRAPMRFITHKVSTSRLNFMHEEPNIAVMSAMHRKYLIKLPDGGV